MLLPDPPERLSPPRAGRYRFRRGRNRSLPDPYL